MKCNGSNVWPIKREKDNYMLRLLFHWRKAWIDLTSRLDIDFVWCCCVCLNALYFSLCRCLELAVCVEWLFLLFFLWHKSLWTKMCWRAPSNTSTDETCVRGHVEVESDCSLARHLTGFCGVFHESQCHSGFCKAHWHLKSQGSNYLFTEDYCTLLRPFNVNYVK